MTLSPSFDVSRIAARVQLSTLSLSKWQPVRQHKGETKAVQEKHASKAPRVSVTLCEHPALEALTVVHNAARADHLRLTLPSAQDGMRMLPAGRHFEHAETMRSHRAKHEAIVAEFCAAYPAIRDAAPVRLNGLYEAKAWPVDISDKFGWSLRYLACPTAGEWGTWLQESAALAQSDFEDRLRDALARVVERCSQAGRLHETVFTGLRELVELAPDMDLAGRLDSLAAAAAPLAAVQADMVRDSADMRADCARQASGLLAMLGGVK